MLKAPFNTFLDTVIVCADSCPAAGVGWKPEVAEGCNDGSIRFWWKVGFWLLLWKVGFWLLLWLRLGFWLSHLGIVASAPLLLRIRLRLGLGLIKAARQRGCCRHRLFRWHTFCIVIGSKTSELSTKSTKPLRRTQLLRRRLRLIIYSRTSVGCRDL
jgi:hypothetical protein